MYLETQKHKLIKNLQVTSHGLIGGKKKLWNPLRRLSVSHQRQFTIHSNFIEITY